VRPGDSVETVLRLMREHELPGVPVVNDGGRCVGIITDADLVISEEGADLHLPHYFELFGGVVFLEPLRRFEARLRKAFSSTAGDLMTEDPITIDADRSVEEAARVIAERRHNRLPVVEHGVLVGVVTRLDVLDALTRDEDAALGDEG
jgi:CBS domain-containing protein